MMVFSFMGNVINITTKNTTKISRYCYLKREGLVSSLIQTTKFYQIQTVIISITYNNSLVRNQSTFTNDDYQIKYAKCSISNSGVYYFQRFHN